MLRGACPCYHPEHRPQRVLFSNPEKLGKANFIANLVAFNESMLRCVLRMTIPSVEMVTVLMILHSLEILKFYHNK